MAARGLPRFGGAAYVAAKSALSGLMRSVVSEYSQYGVTANIVAPGNIMTNMTSGVSKQGWEEVCDRVPLHRIGQPEDVAGIISFLCSSSGNFINGTTIDVNGGEFISP